MESAPSLTMVAMNRTWAVFAAVTAVVIAAVWLLPPVGLAAALVMLALLPPWGRTVVERAAISFVVMLGVIAVVFPRAGSTPVTHTSAHLLITVILLALLALRAVPRLRVGNARGERTRGRRARGTHGRGGRSGSARGQPQPLRSLLCGLAPDRVALPLNPARNHRGVWCALGTAWSRAGTAVD
jgi:hypothetical protein